VATLGVRLVLGLLSLMLGVHKIFLEGLEAQLRWFVDLEPWFPMWVLVAVNIYAAFVELIAGFMLCIGLKRDLALYLILSVLVVVTFGHGLERAVWDLHQLVFRLAMLVALLLLPAEWDIFRLDKWSNLIQELKKIGASGGKSET
jgi:uncharacterized membrane protein YphA (DoxX/SURF4 family)